MTRIELSSEQSRAVRSNRGAIIVVAAAGSGKTEIVARRIERLLQESESEHSRILAVSYTTRAANELEKRFRDRLGDLQRRVDSETIHGFALSLLRQYGTRIGLPIEPEVVSRNEDRAELLAEWLIESGRSLPGDARELFDRLDLARARCENAPLLEDWREALAAHGAVDYPAMLDRASELLENSWVRRHLRRIYRDAIVDEAQNLTLAQYQLLTQVIGDPTHRPLRAMLVGDERQSIVGFAGADRTLMKRFERDYEAQRIELHTNFRSVRTIVAVERAVAARLGQPSQAGEDIKFPAEGRVVVHADETEESEGHFVAKWVVRLLSDGFGADVVAPGESTHVQPEQIGILARSAASLRMARNALSEKDVENASASTEDDWVTSSVAKALVEIIAYRSAPNHVSTRRRLARICGSEAIHRTDLASLLESAIDDNVVKLAQLQNADSPKAMLDKAGELSIDDWDWSTDFDQLQDAWLSFADRTSAVDLTFGNFRQHIARCQRGDTLAPGVRLLTIHKAQGREFRAVAVIACNEGQLPDFRARSDDEKAAELRTFYVAVSRTSRFLLLTRAKQRRTRFGARVTEPSSFLGLIPHSARAGGGEANAS